MLVIAAWRAYGRRASNRQRRPGHVGLLHFDTRLMGNVMQKARHNPIGYVASAVMLNAKLKPGVNLMHVMAMTRALGEQLSAEARSLRSTAGRMARSRM